MKVNETRNIGCPLALSRQSIGGNDVTRAEFYRLKAAEAEQEARGAPEQKVQHLLEVAKRWQSLAMLAEAQEAGEPQEIAQETNNQARRS